MTKYIAKKPNTDGFIEYTQEENKVWATLYARQMKTIEQRACDQFFLGLEKLNMPSDRIPQCQDINTILQPLTGWTVEPVEVIIPLSAFYTMLSKRQFPAATFIRCEEELDYLQEPDIFHELYGHCPLLTDPAYADFMHWYGQFALTVEPKFHKVLGRLFWFTIEFGLVTTSKGLRIYGGGILSSHAETIYALESKTPQRLTFDLDQVIRTDYRYDQIQPIYYILDTIDRLFTLADSDLLNSRLASFKAQDTNTKDSRPAC